jgi:hypothetical protein
VLISSVPPLGGAKAHYDDDQIVDYADSGPLSAKLVPNGTLKTYHGFPHGMPTTPSRDHQRRPARIHQVLTGRACVNRHDTAR